MHLSIPFAAEHGAGPKLSILSTRGNGALAGLLRRLRSIEQALTVSVEVSPTVRLELIGQDAEQEMVGGAGRP
jgi:hypothetical protein